MFTGLIEAEGTLVSRTKIASGARLLVKARFTGNSAIVLGESIATDGVCLTVDEIGAGGFYATASSETLAKSTLGEKRLGAKLNLERALPVGGRLGGHIVAGHVDGVGHVESATANRDGVATRVTFAYPESLSRYIAEKGSIAIDGVSLTINGLSGLTFHVMLVPHTRTQTAWALTAGERVNLEVDVLARYVARILDVGRSAPHGHEPPEKPESSSNEAWLARLAGGGFM